MKYNHLLGERRNHILNDHSAWLLMIIKCFNLVLYSLQTLSGTSVKVIQLLQHFEQLSSVFAQAVFVWSTEFGVRAIIGEIIR